MYATMLPGIRYAVAGAALLAGHDVGDYLVQRDSDAAKKGTPGPAGAAACTRHVLSYTATQAAALLAANHCLGLGISRRRMAAALTVSAVTHYAADRCAGRWTETGDDAPLLVQAAHAIGKGPWLTRDPGAAALLDQVWHRTCIALAAGIAATGSNHRPGL
ncbi:hypothetical protein [Streptomyces sp. NPDC053726]|uniref:hypothetical protein n=1 Tax=Streptomyces sp. NPDC053726 TaxID=3365713 RepID=UPI0037CE7936